MSQRNDGFTASLGRARVNMHLGRGFEQLCFHGQILRGDTRVRCYYRKYFKDEQFEKERS